MTTRKTTKKALLGSLLALVLCFAMLVGTTFAWFTDSEFIKGNQIQAGTLDIELDSETALFSFTNKWEPGFTETNGTVLRNIGNLALKYKFSIINVVETDGLYDNKDSDGIANDPADGSRLAEVLEVYVGTSKDDMTTANYLGTLADLIAYEDFDIDPASNGQIKALLPGESADINFLIHMVEEAGNEYMNDAISFDIAIVATQFTYEEDSFDNQYDKDALYPAIEPVVANSDMVIEEVKIDADDYDAEDAIVVNAGANVTINSGNFNGGTTEFGGAGNTAVFANGGNVTIEGGYFTINGLAKDAAGNLDSGHIDLIYAKDNARVYINGGFFEGADDTVWLLNAKDNSGARIFVRGGTFVNWNPREKAAEVAPAGTTEITVYGDVIAEEQDNGDIWYTVQPRP